MGDTLDGFQPHVFMGKRAVSCCFETCLTYSFSYQFYCSNTFWFGLNQDLYSSDQKCYIDIALDRSLKICLD